MGRPTVYGKEIRIDSNNKCIGINLGYNFYCEHESEIGIVEKLNMHKLRELTLLKCCNRIKYRRQISELSKQIKKEDKILSKWNNTPFYKKIFMPSTYSYLKMIIIDNNELRKKYQNTMLEDGRYYMLSIGNGMTPEVWEKKFGNKKTISEEDLFYMPDYQGLCREQRFILSSENDLKLCKNFAASWACSCDFIILVIPYENKSYLEDLQQALKNGSLACVNSENRLFHDRGCCLIDLEAAYKIRI